MSQEKNGQSFGATGHDNDVDNVLMMINILASFNSMGREAWQMQEVMVLLCVLIIGEHSYIVCNSIGCDDAFDDESDEDGSENDNHDDEEHNQFHLGSGTRAAWAVGLTRTSSALQHKYSILAYSVLHIVANDTLQTINWKSLFSCMNR